MEFLCFTANCGQKFAAKLDDLISVINKPDITRVPGCPDAVIGIFSFRGEFIPVIDITSVYSGISNYDAKYVIILDGFHPYGILVDEINEITRGDVLSDILYLDVYDFERSALTFDNSATHIELF